MFQNCRDYYSREDAVNMYTKSADRFEEAFDKRLSLSFPEQYPPAEDNNKPINFKLMRSSYETFGLTFFSRVTQDPIEGAVSKLHVAVLTPGTVASRIKRLASTRSWLVLGLNGSDCRHMGLPEAQALLKTRTLHLELKKYVVDPATASATEHAALAEVAHSDENVLPMAQRELPDEPVDGATGMDVGEAGETQTPSDEREIQQLETHDGLELDDKPSSPSEVSAQRDMKAQSEPC